MTEMLQEQLELFHFNYAEKSIEPFPEDYDVLKMLMGLLYELNGRVYQLSLHRDAEHEIPIDLQHFINVQQSFNRIYYVLTTPEALEGTYDIELLEEMIFECFRAFAYHRRFYCPSKTVSVIRLHIAKTFYTTHIACLMINFLESVSMHVGKNLEDIISERMVTE